MKLADLKIKPNPKNPRTIKEADFNRLVEKIRRNPQGLEVQKILYKDGIIVAGNQRYKALSQLEKEGLEIQPSWFVDGSDWNEDQIKEFIITSNISDGEWDFDILANEWDQDLLKDWGLNLPDLNDDDFYSRNITSPVYEPTDEKPQLADLVDETRVDKLLMEIEKAELPDDEKKFLKLAAMRHLTFDYSKIADYYANADKATQELMENSALVIIDFKKAIELGYVELSKYITDIQKEDYNE